MYNYSAAGTGEHHVFGACRPGITDGQVGRWLAFMESRGMKRVVCLLSQAQMEDYETPLVERYREFFGPENVLWNPVEDFSLMDVRDMDRRIIPFLKESERSRMPAVVHCWAGMGRTGIVMAAWLSRVRGLSPGEALQAVTAGGRRPMEAVEAGRAGLKELLTLVGGRR
jgi:protein-tyrosine phosphatase